MKKKVLPFIMLSSGALKRNRLFHKQLLWLVLVFTGFSVSAQELVKDLNGMENQMNNEYSSVIDANGTLYFVSVNELWKSNGTKAGTVLVKTFSRIRNLTNVSGTVYFSADDGISGFELWKTNGTAAGTVRIKDIRPGAEGSNPQHLTAVNNTLYFVAHDGTTGRELWKSNGTAASTLLVEDIMRIGGSSNPVELTAVNDRLFFVANNGENGYELWRSNGTASGTSIVKDIYGGSKQSSKPEGLTRINSVLYFSASHPSSGRELWKSDGTSLGTVRVKDIVTGTQSSAIDNMVNVDGILFFSANDKIHGEELWKSNGTPEGTVMVKDLTPGPKGSGYRGVFTPDMTNFTAINDKLYFTAHNEHGYYFWKSDGTEEGTIAFMEATGIGITPIKPDFTLYKNDVYFFNGGGNYPVIMELWRESSIDGSLSKIKTFQLNDYYDSENQPLVKSGNFLYLTAREGDYGYALYQSDGTESGTRVLIDTVKQTDQSSDPQMFLKIGDLIYFITRFNNSERVWVTDGTYEGTYELINLEAVGQLANLNGSLYFSGKDLHQQHWTVYKWDAGTNEMTKLLLPQYDHHPQPYQLTPAGDKLFFIYNSNELWVTDGSTTAAKVEKDFAFLNLFGEGQGGSLYFSASDPMFGTELWKSNGTTTGTVLVKDINPGSSGSSLTNPVFMNNILYFKAYDARGTELWRSNGTAPGTLMVKDTRTNDTDPATAADDMRDMVAVNGTLYFTAIDASSVWWLWKSDGTSAGTVRVSVIPAPGYMLNGNDKLFFVAWDGSYGLWRSEGTAESTFKVRSFGDGCCISSTFDYLTVNDIFYFTFRDSHLWRSDGTLCGTYEIPELDNFPFPIEAIGNEILFGMNNDDIGRELFKFDVSGQAPCSARNNTVARSAGSESLEMEKEKGIMNYPNPFRDNFSLHVSGKDGGTYNAKIMTTNNVSVEDLSALMYNQQYDLGSHWSPGLYLLIIQEHDKMTVRKIVKN